MDGPTEEQVDVACRRLLLNEESPQEQALGWICSLRRGACSLSLEGLHPLESADGGAVLEELYSVRKKQVEPLYKELCPRWGREEAEEAGVAKRRCDGLGTTSFLVPLCLSGLRRIKRSELRLSLARR